MAAKIGGGAGINLPLLLRTLADAIDDGPGGLATHLKPLRTDEWRNLAFTYMIRTNTGNDPREQDVFIDVMSDTLAQVAEPVVEFERQEATGRETQ